MAKKLKAVRAERDEAAPSVVPSPRSDALDDRQMLLIAKAIADPRRMSLLRCIAQKKSACATLRAGLSISAATLSHHMKELETAGLIETSKDGRSLSATLQKKVWKSYIQALKSIGD